MSEAIARPGLPRATTSPMRRPASSVQGRSSPHRRTPRDAVRAALEPSPTGTIRSAAATSAATGARRSPHGGTARATPQGNRSSTASSESEARGRVCRTPSTTSTSASDAGMGHRARPARSDDDRNALARQLLRCDQGLVADLLDGVVRRDGAGPAGPRAVSMPHEGDPGARSRQLTCARDGQGCPSDPPASPRQS